MSVNNLIRSLMARSFRNRKVTPIRRESGPVGWRIEELENRTNPATYNWNGTSQLTVSLGTNESLGFTSTGSSNPAFELVLSGGGDTWTATGTVADGGVSGDELEFNTSADLAGSIAINNTGAGAGTDNVSFTGSATSSGSITVTTSGTIEDSAPLSATGAGSISETASQSITVDANITGGTGGTTLLAEGLAAQNSNGVMVDDGAVVSTTGIGAVSVTGTGGGGPGAENFGVVVSGGTITSGGAGTVTVTGTAGSGAGNFNNGVYVNGSGSTITSGGGGTVTVTGTGGSGQGTNNYGVVLAGGGQITSGGGNVVVMGQGDNGSGVDDYGVNVVGAGTMITSGGDGTVAVTGTGSSGDGDFGIGVVVASGTITSDGGDVSVTGIGSSSGNEGYGVEVYNSGQITSGGNGTVTVSGTGGSGGGTFENGVLVNGSKIMSGGGAISVAGTGNGTSEGVYVYNTSAIASGNNAPITITADSLVLDSTSTINSGTGPTTIATLTSGTLIALGGSEVLSGSPLTLGLSAAEIAQITAGSLNIGNTNSGEIDITTAVITFSSPVVNLTTGSNHAIAFSGGGALSASGNVTLTTSGTGGITSTTGATDIAAGAGTISLNAGSGGIGASGSPIVVDGTNLDATTAGNGNESLNAFGSITLDATGLDAGTGTVELDGGTFMLGDNNPIAASTALNVNGATFTLGAFNQTVSTLTLTSGSITGSTGVLTSTNTIQAQSGSASAILAGTNGLMKTTSGTVTLGGVDTYSGNTTVTSGTLLVTGSLTVSPVSDLASATFGGTGSVQALSIFGELTPGVTGVGTLTADGNVTFTTASAEFLAQLHGTGTGTSNQLAESGGTVALGTQTALIVIEPVPTSTGQAFTIISGAGNITGTFVGLANNATFVSDGRQFRITYSTSTVTLTDLGSALTPSTLPPGEVGLSYDQTITPAAGSPTAILTVSGVTNSTGLMISGSGTGQITVNGAPTSAGTVTFTVTPTYTVGTGSGTVYSFTVSPSVVLTPSALPAGEVGVSYSQDITGTGGSAPVTLSVSNITNPTGLSISGSGTGTITLTGTPTAAGTVTFTVTSTDAIGMGTGKVYSFSIDPAVTSPPPPPPLTPQPILVGGLPNGQVNVYTESNGTYTLQETLQPFGDISTDVRTAVGDINGDGIPDYIFAIGPSPTDSTGAAIAATATEFKVMVLSGATGNPVLVQPFDPFLPNPGESPFTAGGFVSAGDFLDNGRDQIVVSPDQQGGPRVAIYDMNGAATAGSQPATPVGVNTTEINPGSGLTRINNFLSVNANFRGGARTAVGDLNGDGVPDLAIAAGFGGGPAVLVINGTKVPTTTGFTPTDDLIGDFFAFNSTLRDGAYLAIGDVLSNGQQDLILGPGAGGPAEVEVLSGEQIVNQGALAAIANPVANFVPTGLGPNGSGLRVAVAATGVGDDVNVVVGAGRNMPGLVKVYPGGGFSSGSTNEPTGGQLITPFGGGALTDGIFVG